MGMFKWAKEESEGSPLFSAALGAGAIAANPAAVYLREHVLGPRYFGTEQKILGAAGEVTREQVKALKRQLIDKSIRGNLLVLPAKDAVIGSFIRAPKNFLPERAELENLIRKGGLPTLEGVADPLKAIEAIRSARGFVALPRSGSHAVTLAHELGHATSLNPGSYLRRSFPYKFLDGVGRAAIESGTRTALGAALLAGSFDSDDKTKWVVPGALGLTQAAVLGEEALASRKALNALDALKNRSIGKNVLQVVGEEGGSRLLNPTMLENAGKSLRQAWGTYGLSAAGLLAAPLLAIKAREQWDKSHRN